MKRLKPHKLHVNILAGLSPVTGSSPRRYTLTHSDLTADLFLTIADDYNMKQVSGTYTRLMKDEVFAEIISNSDRMEFRSYCHVSGGFVIGTAWLRNKIFRSELPLALESIRYGDRAFFEKYPDLDRIPVIIYFNSTDSRYNKVEQWGLTGDYL